jgi:hypothetical protein
LKTVVNIEKYMGFIPSKSSQREDFIGIKTATGLPPFEGGLRRMIRLKCCKNQNQ